MSTWISHNAARLVSELLSTHAYWPLAWLGMMMQRDLLPNSVGQSTILLAFCAVSKYLAE
jgi:hypothetical protein